MQYFVVFFITLLSFSTHAQTSVSGTTVSDITGLPVSGANIININKVKGTTSDAKGNFTIEAVALSLIHI